MESSLGAPSAPHGLDTSLVAPPPVHREALLIPRPCELLTLPFFRGVWLGYLNNCLKFCMGKQEPNASRVISSFAVLTPPPESTGKKTPEKLDSFTFICYLS